MAFTVGKFSFDKTTMVSLAVVLGVLLVGFGIGHVKGENSVQKQLIDQGAQQQSLAGVVQSTSKTGFTLKIDNKVTGSSGVGLGSSDQAKPEGTWLVKYAKGRVNISSSAGGGNIEDLKKGDKVQVSGLQIGTKTVVAQSVTKILPPTPSPSASPAPKK